MWKIVLKLCSALLASCRDNSEPTTEASEEAEDDAEDEEEDEKKDKEAMTTKKLVTKAVLMLLAGTIVCAVVSDPMVDAVSNFSTVRTCPRLIWSPESMQMQRPCSTFHFRKHGDTLDGDLVHGSCLEL